MSQQNITGGQTPLLVSDFSTRLQNEDSDYRKSGVDFLTPFKTVLPAYAASYANNYYKVASQTSAPTTFSAPQANGVLGAIFEENLPADCIDDGLLALEIWRGTTPSTLLNESLVVKKDDESAWDMSTSTHIYWRNAGRKFRVFIGASYTGSSGSTVDYKWAASYKRFPTYPAVTGDAIDAPAEDVETLYQSWKSSVVKV